MVMKAEVWVYNPNCEGRRPWVEEADGVLAELGVTIDKEEGWWPAYDDGTGDALVAWTKEVPDALMEADGPTEARGWWVYVNHEEDGWR